MLGLAQMGEAPESPVRAALRTGAQLVLAGREAGGYRLLLEAGFGCIERGVASSLAAGQRGGAYYEKVPCDEAVERFLDAKLRSRQFIEAVATCASPEGLLLSAARNFATDLLRRRAAERVTPLDESRDEGPAVAWRGESRALFASHDEDANDVDNVPAAMAAEQLAARERFERLRLVDRIMVKLYFALGPLSAEEAALLAGRRSVSADEVQREVAARVDRFAQARSARDQALTGRRERLLLLRDRVALLVSLMQRLGEPVPNEQSASSGERWPCPVTEHQLLRLSTEDGWLRLATQIEWLAGSLAAAPGVVAAGLVEARAVAALAYGYGGDLESARALLGSIDASRSYEESTEMFLRYERARALLALGQNDDAIGDARRALELGAVIGWRPLPGVLRALAWALRGAERDAEAAEVLALLERAVEESGRVADRAILEEARGGYREDGVVA